MSNLSPLDPQSLLRRCDVALLDFETTAELSDAADIVGQSRALDAVRFGIDIKQPGFNLFVLGEPGSGRHAAVRRLLEEKAASEPAPSDWCYVNNFADPNKPRLLRLPPGRGGRFRHDMQQFVAELGKAIGAAFESEEYRVRIEAIQDEFKQREENALRTLGQESGEKGVALLRTPHGFVFAPVKGEETMGPEEFEKLSDEEKARIGKLIEEYGERLHKLMHQFPQWRREMQGRIKEASRETMGLAVGHIIEELKERYTDLLNVLAFLDEAMRDVIESSEELREQPKSDGDMSGVLVSGSISLARYQVNLLVDTGTAKAAPVVFEDNPIYPNLVGRVDSVAHMGTLVTNFTMIKPGALQHANGGYLVLDAAKVLSQPYAWEGLKRALRSAQVRIESLGQVFGFTSMLPLEPEPMPLNLKVVLVGERILYYLLKEYDPEFEELFKVGADFESDVARNEPNTRSYARFLGGLARHYGLRPFDRLAVARLIEHSARLAGDAEKLSASSRSLADLMQEASHHAGQAGRDLVTREDVEAALQARRHRASRLHEAIQEQILRGSLLIDSGGGQVGQVNGLAVIDLGDALFAHPVRITATARIGEGDVIDIERESELGGAIHSKGVMILSSFLAARYARSLPLSLSASLVFEQSYGPVEGDSASLAELCALLSALAAVPIRQSLAITGSVNQYGRVQPIGGVNEKIEGFFDICQARGLTGEQGVIIPQSNVKHLMLREDVVAACAAGKFAVHAVEEVDQAIALLTGVPAGEPDAQGLVPEGTINYLVATQLAELTALRQAFAAAGQKRGGRKDKA
ncbi:MAG: AAA family ATPase [Rhodocyclaceae bacterium]|jgi:lon-related putative ATP-dependent protease|nr:AAA family ATPase [Rhodocyclaceae bacterium]